MHETGCAVAEGTLPFVIFVFLSVLFVPLGVNQSHSPTPHPGKSWLVGMTRVGMDGPLHSNWARALPALS